MKLGEGPTGEGLLDLLMACHARIRRFSALAVKLGEGAGTTDAERVEAAQACLRYFTEALPLHVLDEESSLWPRLKGCAPEVARAIRVNEAEHAAHRPKLAALDAALRTFIRAPGSPWSRQQLARAASEVEPAFAAHLQLEETVLFPALQAQLSADQQADAVAELRTRRRS